MIRAIVGAGGKTSLIKKMAREYRKQGRRVFVTTSTHMFAEQDTLVTEDADIIIEELKTKGYVMAGSSYGEKIKALPLDVFSTVCKSADEVLIEADGSKHLPLKFPNEGEPVIYDCVEEIVVVFGLHGLGKKAKDVIHRSELAEKRIGLSENIIICAEHIEKLVMEGYVKRLREQYPDKTVKIETNMEETLYERAVASLIRHEEPVNSISEEWFVAQPQLIVLGAGHVATELVKMASMLDFYIKVIDDREEFANKERVPMADEVICDSFDSIDKYIGDPQAYYVVVTRGHKSDFECVNKIMNSSYQYLGMIGSRKKVQVTIERLLAEGYSEEKIKDLHSPIGLSIGAKTPAEIAVSILAEIIQEKNKRSVSCASKEILEMKEKGTLCIIIDKKGSAPRGVGSMMFVGENCVIDSIGGGTVEKAVIEDAGNVNKVIKKEYHLSNEDGADLGMVCGGSNTVLFIPV